MADNMSRLARADGFVSDAQSVVAATAYSRTLPWTPPTDAAVIQYKESPVFAGHMAVPTPGLRSQSFDLGMASTPVSAWAENCTPDFVSYGQGQAPTPASMTYFPSPSATPHIRPLPVKSKSMPAGAAAAANGACTCFTLCLQSLQALHNASSPACPPLDEVLSLNSKAVEGCATMLACSRCMRRSGTHTATMLLATVIGKITSFYKAASKSHFEENSANAAAQNSPGLGVSLGAYQINGNEGRRFELEILTLELRKLEELCARFREVCADLSEDPDVSRAMIKYLNSTLGSTIRVVNHRKEDMGYS
jgi:hypothetical protein